MISGEYSTFQSVIGTIFVVTQNQKISEIHIGKEDFLQSSNSKLLTYNPENVLLIETIRQLEEYFLGERRSFTLPLEQKGTAFQMSVWSELDNIPFGQTKSYQDIASAIGNSKAVRAIGQANKANKLPIIIPCHRVIGKNLSLTGYAGKRTDIKEKLLLLEGAAFKKI